MVLLFFVLLPLQPFVWVSVLPVVVPKDSLYAKYLLMLSINSASSLPQQKLRYGLLV